MILLNSLKHFFRPINLSFNESEKKIVNEIQKNGFFMIENFFDKNLCEEIINKIDLLLNDEKIKIHRPSASDERIFGSEKLDRNIMRFHEDETINKVLISYEKSNEVNSLTLASKLSYKKGNLGSGEGWHRDRVDKIQSKAILYLNDVEPEGGTFQYLKGSHKLKNVFLDNMKIKKNLTDTRFSSDEVDILVKKKYKKIQNFSSKAGSIVFFDSRGIHRGSPISKNFSRYALTLYTWFNQDIPFHIKENSN